MADALAAQQFKSQQRQDVLERRDGGGAGIACFFNQTVQAEFRQKRQKEEEPSGLGFEPRGFENEGFAVSVGRGDRNRGVLGTFFIETPRQAREAGVFEDFPNGADA